MFIAMNRFQVRPGKESDFETVWRDRDTFLKDVPGFVDFRLIRGPDGEGHSLYATHTLWESREAFEGWTKSEAFRAAHKGAGGHGDLYAGPPKLELFETVLEISR